MEWARLYEAFEIDQIDAVLIPAAYYIATQIYKLARYATLIQYGYTLNLTTAVNEREFAKLTPDMQEILIQAVEEAGEYCTLLAEEQTKIDLKLLSDEFGIPVIHPDENEWRQQFSDALRKVCLQGLLPVSLYEEIQSL